MVSAQDWAAGKPGFHFLMTIGKAGIPTPKGSVVITLDSLENMDAMSSFFQSLEIVFIPHIAT